MGGPGSPGAWGKYLGVLEKYGDGSRIISVLVLHYFCWILQIRICLICNIRDILAVLGHFGPYGWARQARGLGKVSGSAGIEWGWLQDHFCVGVALVLLDIAN